MAYERYIKRGGKIYGPYYQHSVKKDGKVISEYIKKPNVTEDKSNKKFKKKLIVFIGLGLLGILIILAFLNFNLTGNVLLEIENNYLPGEQIQGSVKLNLVHGEFIPTNTKVVIDNSGSINEYLLSEFISASLISDGDFYVEGKEISGTGKGYGTIGKKEIYPEVEFTLKISENKKEKNNGGKGITGKITAEIDLGEKSEGFFDFFKNLISLTGNFITGNIITEELIEETEEPEEITEVIEEPEEEPVSEIIGTVSKDNPYSYILEKGQTAEIIGSEQDVDMKIKGNVVEITTDYSETSLGHGESYLTGDVLELNIDLTNLGLVAKEGELSFSLVYDEDELVSVSRAISVESVPEPEKKPKQKNENLSTSFPEIIQKNVTEQNVTEVLTEVNISVNTIQFGAIVGKPVKWKKKIKSAIGITNISLKLPKEATNIIAYKIVEEVREEIDFVEKITDVELTVSSFEEVDETKEIILEENSTEFEVEYETPAPIAFEEITENKKNIIISSKFNYKNVLAFTELPKEVSNSRLIKLYHIVNGSKLLTNFEAFDTNNNSLVDYIEWVVPHLSNQTYELEIIILNVQSYPTVGGNWEVRFTTDGVANLTISAVEGTTWSNDDDYGDLRFMQVRCGENVLGYEWINDSVFIQDYSCNETGYEVSGVLTTGRHVLEFDFGGQTAQARNSASGPIPQTINLHGKLTNSTGSAVNGTYNMTFRIYDAAEGGAKLWESANNSVVVDINGVYSHILSPVNISFDGDYYLGVQINDEDEMTPLINLTSTPYSFRANITDNLDSTLNYQVANLTADFFIGNGSLLTDVCLSNGTGCLVSSDTDTQKSSDNDLLYNDSTTIYFNRTKAGEDLNVNSSNFWDDYNIANTTWFQNIAGALSLNLSQLTSWTDSWLTTKTTDDLSEGSTNKYDNSSWNETYAGTLYADISVATNNASWNETHADTLYIEQSNEANLNVNNSNSTTWWNGISGWVTGWFYESGDTLTFNETKLNETIDARSDFDTDTNETIRFDNLVTTNCTGTNKMIGTLENGTPLCAADEDYCSGGNCGSLVIDGNLTILGDYVNASVTNQLLNGSFLPSLNGVFDMGSVSQSWATIYADNLIGALNWNNLTNVPAGFSDEVDNDTTYSHLSNFTDDLGHVEDNSSWNETYAGTLYSAIGDADNSSWNETHADTLYAKYNFGANNFNGSGSITTTGNLIIDSDSSTIQFGDDQSLSIGYSTGLLDFIGAGIYRFDGQVQANTLAITNQVEFVNKVSILMPSSTAPTAATQIFNWQGGDGGAGASGAPGGAGGGGSSAQASSGEGGDGGDGNAPGQAGGDGGDGGSYTYSMGDGGDGGTIVASGNSGDGGDGGSFHLKVGSKGSGGAGGTPGADGADGEFTIGDGGTTNYLSFSPTGDMTANGNAGDFNFAAGNLTTTGNITASYFLGNGSQLTGITHTPADNSSWNETHADTLYAKYQFTNNNINGSGNFTTTGTVQAEQLTSTDDAFIQGNLKIDGTLGIGVTPDENTAIRISKSFTGTGTKTGIGGVVIYNPASTAENIFIGNQGNAFFTTTNWGVGSLVVGLDFFPTAGANNIGSVNLDTIGMRSAGLLNIVGRTVTINDATGLSIAGILNAFGGTDSTTANDVTVIHIQDSVETTGTWQSLTGIKLDKQTRSTVLNQGIWMNGDGAGADIIFGAGKDSFDYWDGSNRIINTTTGSLNILNNTGYGTIVAGNGGFTNLDVGTNLDVPKITTPSNELKLMNSRLILEDTGSYSSQGTGQYGITLDGGDHLFSPQLNFTCLGGGSDGNTGSIAYSCNTGAFFMNHGFDIAYGERIVWGGSLQGIITALSSGTGMIDFTNEINLSTTVVNIGWDGAFGTGNSAGNLNVRGNTDIGGDLNVTGNVTANTYFSGVNEGFTGSCVNTTYSGGIAISCND